MIRVDYETGKLIGVEECHAPQPHRFTKKFKKSGNRSRGSVSEARAAFQDLVLETGPTSGKPIFPTTNAAAAKVTSDEGATKKQLKDEELFEEEDESNVTAESGISLETPVETEPLNRLWNNYAEVELFMGIEKVYTNSVLTRPTATCIESAKTLRGSSFGSSVSVLSATYYDNDANRGECLNMSVKQGYGDEAAADKAVAVVENLSEPDDKIYYVRYDFEDEEDIDMEEENALWAEQMKEHQVIPVAKDKWPRDNVGKETLDFYNDYQRIRMAAKLNDSTSVTDV